MHTAEAVGLSHAQFAYYRRRACQSQARGDACLMHEPMSVVRVWGMKGFHSFVHSCVCEIV